MANQMAGVLQATAIELGNGRPVPVGVRRAVRGLADALRREMVDSAERTVRDYLALDTGADLTTLLDAPLPTLDNAVEHDVADELVGDCGDDLGEVAGEGSVLAGVQPHTPPVCGGDHPVS
jgi:hypothetical protein